MIREAVHKGQASCDIGPRRGLRGELETIRPSHYQKGVRSIGREKGPWYEATEQYVYDDDVLSMSWYKVECLDLVKSILLVFPSTSRRLSGT